MSDKQKSLIRHFLTALGTLMVFLGLDEWTGIVEYVTNQLDTIWDALIAITGFVTTVYGFFRNRDNWNQPAPEVE